MAGGSGERRCCVSAQKKALPYLKVFGDWLVRFQRLDDAQFGRLIRAAIGYVCEGEEPIIDGIEGLSFDYIRPALDNDVVKYQEKVAKNSVNGTKGAVARWGSDSERHTENSERHLSDGENSQEKREKKEEKRYKIDDTRVRDVPERPNTPTEGADVLDSAIEAFESAWRAYTDMLDETGHPLEDPGTTLEHLTEIGESDPKKMAEILRRAITNRHSELIPLNGAGAVISKLAAACSSDVM